MGFSEGPVDTETQCEAKGQPDVVFRHAGEEGPNDRLDDRHLDGPNGEEEGQGEGSKCDSDV